MFSTVLPKGKLCLQIGASSPARLRYGTYFCKVYTAQTSHILLWGGDRERPDTARTRSVLEYGTHKVWNTGSFSILFLLYIVGCIHGKVNSMVSVLADIHVKNAAAPYP